MLNIYLDTNVHSKLSERLYPEKLAEMEKLKSDGKITIYFTDDNLLELICMVENEEGFIKCRDILRFSSRFCSNQVLEDNWRHMQRSIANFLDLDVETPGQGIDWVRTARFISKAKNYKEVRKDEGFLKVRNHIKEFKQEWHKGALDTRNRIKDLFNLKKLPSPKSPILEQLSDEPSLDEIKGKLWDACKGHHRLPDYASRLDYHTAYNKIPTVRYFIDLQRVYYDRMLTEGTKPKESDYFDLEYVIYLDIMDYFVTHDIRRLKCLYNSASPDIAQGLILLEDVSKLECLPPRAPYRDRLGNIRYQILNK